jgi:hypothetical protein
MLTILQRRVSFKTRLIFHANITEVLFMLLQLKDNGELVKVVDVQELIDPNRDNIRAKEQQGQEEQQADYYQKEQLAFPSGENLPRCWMDANYRNANS